MAGKSGAWKPADTGSALVPSGTPRRPIQARSRSVRQSRLMSLVEALTNVVVGYGAAVGTQLLVFPLFGVGATLRQSLGIGAVFTLVSLARGYLLRRAFEATRK